MIHYDKTDYECPYCGAETTVYTSYEPGSYYSESFAQVTGIEKGCEHWDDFDRDGSPSWYDSGKRDCQP